MTWQQGPEPGRPDSGASGGHGGMRHGGHGWMMIACCVPMLIISVVLVAVHVVSIGFLAVAIACTVMMALMMRGMGHGSSS
jgi:hypothetical protein